MLKLGKTINPYSLYTVSIILCTKLYVTYVSCFANSVPFSEIREERNMLTDMFIHMYTEVICLLL